MRKLSIALLLASALTVLMWSQTGRARDATWEFDESTVEEDSALNPVVMEEETHSLHDWSMGRRDEVITYTVHSGDTVWSVARMFHLDVDTLRWSNPELARNPDRVYVGQVLTILPVKGVYHTIRPGETVESLARRYGVKPEDITGYRLNHLAYPYTLKPGEKIIIPGGEPPRYVPPRPHPVPGYKFAWPAIGPITQGFSSHHRAIDIGLPYGSPIYASRAGRVVYIGLDHSGYGYLLILSHADGTRTYYAHLSGYWVHEGDRVRQGQIVGTSGSTGNSSGPHLHFEIRQGHYIHLNPLDYLPPR